MKTTIAYKKHSAGIIYILTTVFSMIWTACSLSGEFFIAAVGVLIILISATMSIRYLMLPSDIIVLLNDNTLMLPKGTVISLDSICDVSYRRATAKGIKYRWGSVTIHTYSEKYKYGFVSECEQVADRLNKLVCQAKRTKEE